MMVNGSKMHIMEKELNNGITIKSFIRVTLLMDLKLDRVNSSSMEIFTKEISLMDSSMEEENISLMKLVKSMKVISTRTKSTEVD
jgi:hypothetical protein